MNPIQQGNESYNTYHLDFQIACLSPPSSFPASLLLRETEQQIALFGMEEDKQLTYTIHNVTDVQISNVS